VRKTCSIEREKRLKFEAEGQAFSKILRSLEQFIQKVVTERFFNLRFFISNDLEQLELEKIIRI
jgi:hypothetical protein